MYLRKILEPETKFPLRIVDAAGAPVRTGMRKASQEKGAESVLHDDPVWMPADASLKENIRRGTGSGRPAPVSLYAREEDIPDPYRADPSFISGRVDQYVRDYTAWYNSSLQQIGALGWNDRNTENRALDKGAEAFSVRGDELSRYLAASRDMIDPEYYNEVMTFLHDQRSFSGDLLTLDRSKRDVFSQFESQSSYDAFLAAWERQDQIQRTAREAPDFDTLSKGSASTMRFGKGGDADDVYYLINGGMDFDPFMDVSAESNPDYTSMSEDEIRVFNYYYNTGDYRTAMEYVELLKESLAQKAAETEFKKYEGRTGKEILYGIEAGLDRFSLGVRGAKDALLGRETHYPTTKGEYLSGMVREDLKDNGPMLPEWMGGASWGQVAYDATTTVGQMLPTALTAGTVKLIHPGAGKLVGDAMVFASSGGNAYIEARRMGYDEKQARFYASLVGGGADFGVFSARPGA